ncbi:MAG: hypothetical protein IKI75_02695 [Lachnospiraceae bacterium]|nr:hypothetical protein [Lachnospiraceae bacterium]
MKKTYIPILASISICALLCACGDTDAGYAAARTGSGTKTVNDVLAEQMAASTAGTAGDEASPTPEDEGTLSADDSINEDAPAADSGAGDVSSVTADSPAEIDEPSTTEASVSSDGDIDVDLAALSGTIVYSEVYNIMMNPSDYIGKKIKMSGSASYYHDEATGNDYYACVISDATACCAQGIEFVLSDDTAYPVDGENIVVAGTFNLYKEGDITYCHLTDAEML